MVYFVKVTKSGKGFLVADKQLSKRQVTMPDGTIREFNTQGGKLGFVACVGFSAHELNLKKDDELDFDITEKPVLDKDRKPLNNLYWAE
jgi:hypothetical protein